MLVNINRVYLGLMVMGLVRTTFIVTKNMANNVRFIDYLVRPSTNMIFMNTAGSNALVLAKVGKGKLRIANFCIIRSCPLLAKYV